MTIDDARPVLVVGLGVMGQQIALQCARFGLPTAMYDVDAAAYDRCRMQQDRLLAEWIEHEVIDAGEAPALRQRLRFETDPAPAAACAQLLIEATPEVLATKLDVFRQFEPLCPADAIIVSNTSYLTASMMLPAVQRAAQFAAFHFYEPAWFANVVDVMPHPGTSVATVEWLMAFARRIDQTPILCRRERPGQVANAILDAALGAAMLRVIDGVAPVDDVDRAWMGVMKTPIGPFGILDRVGLDTAYDIMACWQEVSADPSLPRKMALLKPLIDAGRLGVKTGGGFYDYPSSDFERPDFLRRPARGDGLPSPPPWQTQQAERVTLRRYALAVAGPIDFVINAAINGGIAWFFLRRVDRVPIFGLPSAYVFLAPMVFCVLLFATYFGHANGIAARRKGVGSTLPPAPPGWRTIAWRRGLTAALVGLAVVTLLLGAWQLAQPSLQLSARSVIWADGLLAGVLGYAAQVLGVLGVRHLQPPPTS